MATVTVIYATDYGSTEKMARAIAEGVGTVAGVSARLVKAEEATGKDFLESDAIIMGTPVHMGGPDWRIKKLIDTVCGGLWMKDAITGKVGAVFATGSGYGNGGGGAELAVLPIVNNLIELGLVFVPLPRQTPGYADAGLQWGPYARTGDRDLKPIGIQEEQLVAARHHGANVARVTLALAGQQVFA